VKVGDVMTTTLVTVGPDAPFKEVVELLVRSGVSSLPVVDRAGKLVGLVTEADLVSKEAYPGRRRALALLADVVSARDHHWVTKAAGSVAADVMTRHVTVCAPHEDLHVAARRMLEAGVKRMPVVDDGVLLGMISRHDILKSFDRPDVDIAGDIERVLADPLKAPEGGHVGVAVDGGVVTLTGDVRYEWDERIVVSLVGNVPGVIDVVTRLQHREPNPVPSGQRRMFGAR